MLQTNFLNKSNPSHIASASASLAKQWPMSILARVTTFNSDLLGITMPTPTTHPPLTVLCHNLISAAHPLAVIISSLSEIYPHTHHEFRLHIGRSLNGLIHLSPTASMHYPIPLSSQTQQQASTKPTFCQSYSISNIEPVWLGFCFCFRFLRKLLNFFQLDKVLPQNYLNIFKSGF